jgi:MoxR-like ATPase
MNEKNLDPENQPGDITPDINGSNDSEENFKSRVDLSGVTKIVNDLREGIGAVIVGQKKMVDLLIASLLADGHVLIEGVPGVAKTLTAKILARLVDSEFSRIQFTPDLMPADVIGTSVFNQQTTGFEFKPGPVFSNIVLIDEINRSPAKTQAALFEVMEERQVTVDGHTYPFKSPFLVMATQNPIEHEGTYRLPEAQLDRFLFKISVPYPSLEEEVNILDGSYQRKNRLDLSTLEKKVTADEIVRAQEVVSKIHVEKKMMHFIAEIIQKTRSSSQLSIGASPRASVFVMRAAQAAAAMKGRDFITPEDVKEIIGSVLRHRVILTPEKEMEGVSPDKVITTIVESVEVPR